MSIPDKSLLLDFEDLQCEVPKLPSINFGPKKVQCGSFGVEIMALANQMSWPTNSGTIKRLKTF